MQKFWAVLLLGASMLFAQEQPIPPPAPQNPSPMTDSARAHRRVPQTEVPGQRWKLSLGTLLLPDGARVGAIMPLMVHFHGAPWLAEWSAVQRNRHAAVLTIHLGAGSGVYVRAFADPNRFSQLLEEAARTLSPKHPVLFRPVVLSSFSAGYGAIREILKNPENRDRIDVIVLADSLHTGYIPDGKPGALDTAPLAPFLEFARAAAAGRKQMIITHSEIFPGTFASTTETADYMISSLQLKGRPVLKWGPLGMQQLSEARAGRLQILGFAGNTAPDHIDHFHALAHWLKLWK